MKSLVPNRVQHQRIASPPINNMKAPVARQKNVVISRMGKNQVPSERPPSCLSDPDHQSHTAVSDEAVIHIPNSRPVEKKTMGASCRVVFLQTF